MQNELMNNAETSASQELFAKIQTLAEQYKELMSEKKDLLRQTAINDQQIAALLQQYKLLQPLAPKLKQAENAAFSPAEVQQLTDTYTAAKQFVTSFVQLPPAHKERLANLHKQSEQVIGVLAKANIAPAINVEGHDPEAPEAAAPPVIAIVKPAALPQVIQNETSYVIEVDITSTGANLKTEAKISANSRSYKPDPLTLVGGKRWTFKATLANNYGAIDVDIIAEDSNGKSKATVKFDRKATPPKPTGVVLARTLQEFPQKDIIAELAIPIPNEEALIATLALADLVAKDTAYYEQLCKAKAYLAAAERMQTYLTTWGKTWNAFLGKCEWGAMSKYAKNPVPSDNFFETLKTMLGADWATLMNWGLDKKVADVRGVFINELNARIAAIEKNITAVQTAIGTQTTAATQALQQNAPAIAPLMETLANERLHIKHLELKYAQWITFKKNKYGELVVATNDFSEPKSDEMYANATARAALIADANLWATKAAAIDTAWKNLCVALAANYAANPAKKSTIEARGTTSGTLDTALLDWAKLQPQLGSYYETVFINMTKPLYRNPLVYTHLKAKAAALSNFNANTNTLPSFPMDDGLHPEKEAGAIIQPAPEYADDALAQKGKDDTHVISPDDIVQNGIGDCYFLSSMAGLAKVMPNTIYDAANPQNSIVSPKLDGGVQAQTADGKPIYIVKLYVPNGNGTSTRMNIEVVGDAVKMNAQVRGASYKAEPLADGNGDEQDLWVVLIEKAFAQVRGMYPSIASGAPDEAMKYLLGDTHQSKTLYIKDIVSKEEVDAALTAAKMAHFATLDDETKIDTANLVKGHAYLFEELIPTGYKLRNPHNRGTVGASREIVEIEYDVLMKNFEYIELTL